MRTCMDSHCVVVLTAICFSRFGVYSLNASSLTLHCFMSAVLLVVSIPQLHCSLPVLSPVHTPKATLGHTPKGI